MAMKIRPSVRAARGPVGPHHSVSCAGNQWTPPKENAARAATMIVQAIAYGSPAALTGLPVFGLR